MDIQFPFFSLFIFGEMFFSEFVHFKLLSLLIVVHNNPFFIICKICNDAPSFIPNIINCFFSLQSSQGLSHFFNKTNFGFCYIFLQLVFCSSDFCSYFGLLSSTSCEFLFFQFLKVETQVIGFNHFPFSFCLLLVFLWNL